MFIQLFVFTNSQIVFFYPCAGTVWTYAFDGMLAEWMKQLILTASRRVKHFIFNWTLPSSQSNMAIYVTRGSKNHFKWGSKRCGMMRGFQICHQNSNRITFEPLLARKLWKIGNILDLAYLRQFCGAKRGLNITLFEFWGQNWNPLIISHLLGPHLIWFAHFDFFDLPCYFFFTTNMGGSIFF